MRHESEKGLMEAETDMQDREVREESNQSKGCMTMSS